MFKLLYNRFYFIGSKITEDGDYSHETNLDSILKSRDITLLAKVCIVKAVLFSSSHVWMWELDHKEGWEPKNILSNYGAREDSWESLGQQGDHTSQS